MYVSDARTPMPSLYTKALPCLSDIPLLPTCIDMYSDFKFSIFILHVRWYCIAFTT